MRDPWNDSEIARRFQAHSETAFARAPLNAALAGIIARDPSLHSLLAHAPLEQQLPVLLMAAIHSLLLAEADHPLADWYPNLRETARDPGEPELTTTLTEFVHERSPSILSMMEHRRVQTNEVGRCAFLLAAFAQIGPEAGPLAHVDVGTSAGLNTLLPRFSYRYDDDPIIGSGAPLIECSTRGHPHRPITMPEIAASRGIDLRPIDVMDPADAHWLQACCWPDQTDRFDRLAAAIRVAQSHPPDIVVGDAIESIGDVTGEAASAGHPVITTSWVLNYLEPADRHRFVDRLDDLGAESDISWVFAESPALTPELPHAPGLAEEHTTELGLVTWRDGERRVEHLATCHPHGYWLHWQ